MKTAVFIDGPNFWTSLKTLGKHCDFLTLKQSLHLRFSHGGEGALNIGYYTATYANDDGFMPFRTMLDFMSYNGYKVIEKTAKVMTRERSGQTHIKGNMDVELAVDIVCAAEWADNIVLFSGDGDFAYALNHARSRGCQIFVYSTCAEESKTGNVASDLLRRAAHSFTDFARGYHDWLTDKGGQL